MVRSLRQRDTKFSLARHQTEIREIVSGPNALAHIGIGSATASVSFRKSESQWGSLKQHKAGILHFHTSRMEPRGCKLRELNMRLTFDGKQPNAPLSKSASNVYLLHRPTPEFFTGGKRTRDEEKSFSVNPNIPTPIGNLTVGSYEKRSKAEIEDAWTYTSQWEPEGQVYRTAVWQWLARDAALQLEDVADLHGGVVISHEGHPFYVRCAIDGRLLSDLSGRWSQRRWYRFSSARIENGHLYCIEPDSAAQTDLESQMQDLENSIRASFERSRASEYSTTSLLRRKVLKIISRVVKRHVGTDV